MPEPPAQPVSRRGDLWLLGNHKLLCGDATSAEDVARLGDHGHLMVTDPPYGVDYHAEWRDKALPSMWGAIKSTGRPSNDDISSWPEAWSQFTGDVIYCWCGHLSLVVVARDLEIEGFRTAG